MKNRVYTTNELVEAGIFTDDFEFMDKPGEYNAVLLMRGSSYCKMLRLFFQLEDGRKIITPVFNWQRFLGFFEVEDGTELKFTYQTGPDGKVFLKRAERL